MADVRKNTHKSVDEIFDKADVIGAKATKIKEGVDDFISDNPEKSVLIALGTGIIVGGVLAAIILKKKK